MNILLLDQFGMFLDFALRCQAAGHNVKWFVMDTKYSGERIPVGDGLSLRVDNWRKWTRWASLIIAGDNARMNEEINDLIKRGFPVMATSSRGALLELDRDRGQQVFEECGLDVMPSTHFDNYDDAIAFVKKEGRRFVSKPDGDADKALSYVSQSPRDMLSMLERWKGLYGNKRREFILQEFVPGIEMAVGGWFGPGGFNNYFIENFEFKKFMNDNLGPNTGEQGTVTKYVTAKNSKLAQETLLKVEPELEKLNYCGFVDISVIVDKSGRPRPLEFTARPAWPLFYIQQALHDEHCEWMLDLYNGFDTLIPSEQVAIGVVMTIPHYPYSHLTRKELCGYPIYDLDDNNPYRDNLHPAELMWDKAPDDKGKMVPMFVSAGDYLVIASGTGKTVSQAKLETYKAVRSIEVPNSVMYRTDIGDRLEAELPKLQENGFATEWSF